MKELTYVLYVAVFMLGFFIGQLVQNIRNIHRMALMDKIIEQRTGKRYIRDILIESKEDKAK